MKLIPKSGGKQEQLGGIKCAPLSKWTLNHDFRRAYVYG